jgi:hypothetical protein
MAFIMGFTSIAFPATALASGNRHFVGNGFTEDFNINNSWNSGYGDSLTSIINAAAGSRATAYEINQ